MLKIIIINFIKKVKLFQKNLQNRIFSALEIFLFPVKSNPICAMIALPRYVPIKTKIATIATRQEVFRKSIKLSATDRPANAKIGVVIDKSQHRQSLEQKSQKVDRKTRMLRTPSLKLENQLEF